MRNSLAHRLAVSGTLMLLIVGAAAAGPPNGVQREEWSFDWPDEGLYIPCLNDTLNGTMYVTTLFHSFETPSGTVHWIESYYGVGYVYSKTTGNTWTSRFKYPINGNVRLGKGEIYKFQNHIVFVPDEGDGRVYFEESSMMIVVNGNGELKVERELPPPGSEFPADFVRCAGKPD